MDDLAAHGGDIHRYTDGVLDFSASINPLGLSSGLREAICKNLDRVLHYPDSEACDLTQKIARYWGIDEDNILLGNGTASLIYLILSSFGQRM